ncbi:MAG TPA: hypothetical protein RMH99_15615, partial [Sandaracinaceae bacterium LLY-WYZ-13_1]|nr:hypothetical protein [Sandaracinaceae bacterium LLY-WYZ-13_1]
MSGSPRSPSPRRALAWPLLVAVALGGCGDDASEAGPPTPPGAHAGAAASGDADRADRGAGGPDP